MKQASLFILAIIMAISSFSNNPLPDNGDCFTLTKDHDSASIVLPPPMVEIMSEIISAIGIKQDFILKEANVLNLQATMLHRKKVILYNPEFMNTINHLTKDKWPAYALLAHEIGHHIKGHTAGRKGSRPAFELEADEFAGAVLYKLGASLEESQEVMLYIAKTEGSRDYPNRAARMDAIERGWNNSALASQ